MKRRIRGLAVPYGAWSGPQEQGYPGEFVEQFEPGAFRNHLRGKPRIYLNHEHGFRHCKGELANTADGSLSVVETDNGIEFEGELPDSHCGREVASAVDRGEMRMSIGFRSRGDVWDAFKKRRWVREAQLTHVSVVRQPAFPQTRVEVRSLLPDLFRTFSDDLRPVSDFLDTVRFVGRIPRTQAGERAQGENWLRSRKFDLLRTAELRSRDPATVEEIRSLLDELIT